MTGEPMAGGCYCGAVSFRVEGANREVVHCHCMQCRHLSGAAFTTWVSVPARGFTLAGRDGLTTFEPTPNVCRHFCRTCGTHVYTEDRRWPGIVGLPAGVVTGGAVPPPSRHCYAGSKAAWHRIDDDLPRTDGAA